MLYTMKSHGTGQSVLSRSFVSTCSGRMLSSTTTHNLKLVTFPAVLVLRDTRYIIQGSQSLIICCTISPMISFTGPDILNAPFHADISSNHPYIVPHILQNVNVIRAKNWAEPQQNTALPKGLISTSNFICREHGCKAPRIFLRNLSMNNLSSCLWRPSDPIPCGSRSRCALHSL